MSSRRVQPRVRLTSNAYRVGGPGGAVASAPRMASAAVGAPAGCSRGTSAYVSKELCEANKPSSEMCVPRYINGVWDRFHPYARDSVACAGALPPDLLPQTLNDESLVEAAAWEPIGAMSLGLMNGSIGQFNAVIGGVAVRETFQQSDLVESLDMPLSFVYSVPHDTGRMILTLNLTSGYASITAPHNGGTIVARWTITNIGA